MARGYRVFRISRGANCEAPKSYSKMADSEGGNMGIRYTRGIRNSCMHDTWTASET